MTTAEIAALGAQRIEENRKRETDRRAEIARKLADYERITKESQMSTELVPVQVMPQAIERVHPREIIQQATEEAHELASVIESQKLYAVIQGKKFVKCEGWTTLAILRGCLPREVGVHEEENGRYIATVELVRITDGAVLTRASAECGGPEDPVWANRPPNARRSMAITRATGKACRVAFSWVMALTGYEVTPAEEVISEERTAQEMGAVSPGAPRAIDKGPIPTPMGVAMPWVGIIEDYDLKKGKGADGKEWARHIFRDKRGEEWGTYSDAVANPLRAAMGKKIEMSWEFSRSGKYKDILEFKVL